MRVCTQKCEVFCCQLIPVDAHILDPEIYMMMVLLLCMVGSQKNNIQLELEGTFK